MVVVVQAFATGEPCHQANIGGGIVEVLISNRVAGAVNDGIQGDITRALDNERRQACHWSDPAAECQRETRHKCGDANGQSKPSTGKEPFGTGAGNIARVLLNDAGISGLAGVVISVPQQNVPQSFEQGAVRIALFISEMVVLAVDGYPFAGNDAGKNPKLRLHQHSDNRVQLE